MVLHKGLSGGDPLPFPRQAENEKFGVRVQKMFFVRPWLFEEYSSSSEIYKFTARRGGNARRLKQFD